MKKRVYLGLGSNLGNKKENLARAIEKLSPALGTCAACSTHMESEPWGFDSSNNFVNCVVAFETELSPIEILNVAEQIERELGRTQKSDGSNYHDRTIDIDILLCGNTIMESERLIIPHPLMHKRLFVLQPLFEIAPHTIHPKLNKSIEQLLRELEA